MALRDRALKALRIVFGAEREERAAAESPSAAAQMQRPHTLFDVFGRREMGGLLSISQTLIDRYADYESMQEYPDIACLAAGSIVYVYDAPFAVPTPIEHVAADGNGLQVLAYDLKQKRVVAVPAKNPRLSGKKVKVVSFGLSNGRTIICTPDHKILTVMGYLDAKDLKEGVSIVSMKPGFNPMVTCAMIDWRPGTLKVTKAPEPAGEVDVYDITTDTHNFICEGAVVHNSAFRYYASDATQPNITDGRTIWITSDNQATRGILEDLIRKKLRAEDEAWSQAYSLGMYGNLYEELLVTDHGVVGMNFLPAPTMRRVEALDGGLIGFVQDITGDFTANSHELRIMLSGNAQIPPYIALFEDWQVCHMRLRSTRRRSPYGVSIAEPARWIWKRLIMMEDMAMLYRLTRIPRYAYYVDVTDIPPDRVESFLRKTKRDLKKKKLVNPRTGRLDMRYNPMSHDDDLIIAVREGRELARVDILSSPGWESMEDIDYFKRMLHGSLNVPRAWLGQEEPIQGRAILSNEDVRAARVTLNLQRELRNGYERICRVHLAARGVKDPWQPEFNVLMTAPSGIWELAAYEILNARADYASRVQPFTSIRWIQENILKLSEEEIKAIEAQQKREQALGLGGEGGMEPPAPAPVELGPEGTPAPEEAGAPEGKPAATPEWAMSKREFIVEMDRRRRLEDWRYRESNRRSQEIQDSLGRLMEMQSGFARREKERRAFFKELKETVLFNGNGRTQAVPSGRRVRV